MEPGGNVNLSWRTTLVIKFIRLLLRYFLLGIDCCRVFCSGNWESFLCLFSGFAKSGFTKIIHNIEQICNWMWLHIWVSSRSLTHGYPSAAWSPYKFARRRSMKLIVVSWYNYLVTILLFSLLKIPKWVMALSQTRVFVYHSKTNNLLHGA